MIAQSGSEPGSGHTFALKALPIILKPAEHWLSDTPPDDHHWGFARTRSDYEREKAAITEQLSRLISDLRGEGYNVELQPPLEVQKVGDLLRARDGIDAQLGIVLAFDHYPYGDPSIPLGTVTGLFPPDPQHQMLLALNSIIDHLVIYNKVDPLYSGAFIGVEAYSVLKDRGLANDMIVVTENPDRLRKAIKVIYALEKLRSERLLFVGEPGTFAGPDSGWAAFYRARRKFGFDVKFITPDEFWRDYEEKERTSSADAMRVAQEWLRNAAGVRQEELNDEKLLRGGLFHLLLTDYVRKYGADFLNVQCAVTRVATGAMTLFIPCMSLQYLRDSGYTVVCQGDAAGMIPYFLLRWIANKPVFLADPVFHEGRNTLMLAHCTAPTRMLGFDRPPFRYIARKHHETGSAPAPAVKFEPGTVTVLTMSYDFTKIMVLRGEVVGSPDNPAMCRSQAEIKVPVDISLIRENTQGWHYFMVYGDYVEEIELLARLIGAQLVKFTRSDVGNLHVI
jgi:L-fucose isomerase-like protein